MKYQDEKIGIELQKNCNILTDILSAEPAGCILFSIE